MRNPNRTTKAERRAAKRWNALAARTFGIAETARYMRDGVLLDEATGLDRLMYATLGPWTNYRMSPTAETAITEAFADVAIYGKPMADAMLDATGKVANALTEHVLRPELERLGIDPADYRYEYDASAPVVAPPFEEITEVRADSPDLPEVLRPTVEAFVSGQNGDLTDYTVAYRASELDGDTADVLILPKWERGGVLEDYARLHGTAPTIDLAAAPVGAPPFDTGTELYPGDPNERDANRAEAIENMLADDFDEDDRHV